MMLETYWLRNSEVNVDFMIFLYVVFTLSTCLFIVRAIKNFKIISKLKKENQWKDGYVQWYTRKEMRYLIRGQRVYYKLKYLDDIYIGDLDGGCFFYEYHDRWWPKETK